ncbi:unnamed protein product [Diabrotica balteata]|uniref:Saposin B-type domain-containing protein n=1 Tax=Diabrotica balteata TaxID=107213 RepID=A0A9P0E547_DIABA|nr:unnamed protein product [Diabrotica balteata]
MKTILILALFSCIALTIYAQGPEPTKGPEPEPTGEPDEQRCDTCVTLTTIIRDYIDEKVPLDEVKKDLDRICHDLPDQLKEVCEKELLPNLDRAYEELQKHTPYELCQHYKYC